MEKLLLGGLWTALVTPFKENGEVDFEIIKSLVIAQAESGNNILILGSTGESSTLERDEKLDIIYNVVDALEIYPSIKLMVGISDSCTKRVLDFGKAVLNLNLKIDAFLLSSPPYNKPCQEGLFQHFTTIAKEFSDMPIMLYDIPCRTGVSIYVNTVRRVVADCPNIKGIKDATGNLEKIPVLMDISDEFAVLVGDDTIYYQAVEVHRVHGCVSVMSNLIPDKFSQFSEKLQSGDLSVVRRWNEEMYGFISLMMSFGNPVGIKSMMSFIGIEKIEDNPRIKNVVRLPLVALNDISKKEWLVKYFKDAKLVEL